MIDRTKPPPHCEVIAYPPEGVSAPKGRMYCVGCTTPRGGHAMAYAECADTEARAIALAWDNYDWITLPARVALLRELAAELRDSDPLAGRVFDERPNDERRSLPTSTMYVLATVYTERADALEGKPPTSGR